MEPPPPPPPHVADDAVTASDLARHFGHWQRRALSSPVYVLNHGRPQFVLASIEFMHALNAARTPSVETGLAEVFDVLRDPVLICDRTGVVIAAGRAARLYFGRALQPGAALAAALPAERATYLAGIAKRVADTGLAERTELPGDSGRARLDLLLEPSSSGVVIVGRAAGLADARDAALSRATALADAVCALPGHAIATIGPRGSLIDVDEALAKLTGRPRSALLGTPAVDLFSADSRDAIRSTIDEIFAGEHPRVVNAKLVTGRHAQPASVGLAALYRGLAVEAVQAAIARRT